MMNILLIILTAIFIIESILKFVIFTKFEPFLINLAVLNLLNEFSESSQLKISGHGFHGSSYSYCLFYQTCIPLFSSVSLPLLKHG